jgi:hypothetical protein
LSSLRYGKADEDDDPTTRDITNEAFWHKLGLIYAETKEVISAWAEENGVDLSPSALDNVGEQIERRDVQTRNHPLAKAAEEYAFAVNHWFEEEAIQERVFCDTGTVSNESIVKDDDANDLLEVIRWYQFLIAVKLMRGISSQIEEEEAGEEEWYDSDGSAKVALIGIDRSISAWKLIGELRRDNAETIRKFLLDLERLRLHAERVFPHARDFIRPGFDERFEMLH